MKVKTHDFSHQIQGRDYVLESATDATQGEKFYMTGKGKGIQRQDSILLQERLVPVRYRVESIDYYGNSPSVWIALLSKCG